MTSQVLAIGAHPDDIELGCGGTLAKHAAQGDEVTLLVVTKGQAGPGDTALRVREQEAAAQVLGANLLWGDLPDGQVSNYELDLVHLIERVIRDLGVTVVYSHGERDTHQDHRAVALATWGAARHAEQVLCYDSPSSVGFTPVAYVDITSTLDKKLSALACHATQTTGSQMASFDLVRTQAGYRGFQVRVEAAEGFVPHRLLLPV